MRALVKSYTRTAQNTIRQLLSDALAHKSNPDLVENLFLCLDELVKNGIKGNYKYVLIRELLAEKVKNGDTNGTALEEILQNRDIYNQYTTQCVDLVKVNQKVRAALTEEAQVLSIKNRAAREGRSLDNSEKETIAGFKNYMHVKKLISARDLYVELRVSTIFNSLNIEVSNHSPILDADLQRINDKRSEFNRYAEEGREGEFFMNHIDEMDGGHGLGYATIDSTLRSMGYVPDEILHILSVNNTTILMILKL